MKEKIVKPKFIRENKIKIIEKFIDLKTVGKVKALCKMHLENVKLVNNPDPDELFQLFKDYLETIISNNEHRQVWIDEYKEN